MTSNPAERDEIRYKVLSVRAIWSASVVIVLVGVAVGIWLLLAFGGGDDESRNRLEAIKTAGTVVVGAGGGAALLLTARRQRSAEIALKQRDREQAHQERVAAAVELDAAERRITELYTAAAAQLGSDKAPVRLAGLYALERLAQNNEDQRQTIVNVQCAYLRMPYLPPGQADEDAGVSERERVEEREVRLTAQRLLALHLRPGAALSPAATFWSDITLDLTGAALIDFDLAECVVRRATFMNATFYGGAYFDRTTFNGRGDFWMAEFRGEARFSHTKFLANAHFGRSSFANTATFDHASFSGTADFQHATFAAPATFEHCTFTKPAGTADQLSGGEAFTVFEGTTFKRGKPSGIAQFLPQVQSRPKPDNRVR